MSRQPQTPCPGCKRDPKHAEGCSVIECPLRKPWGITDRPHDCDSLTDGGYRLGRIPDDE